MRKWTGKQSQFSFDTVKQRYLHLFREIYRSCWTSLLCLQDSLCWKWRYQLNSRTPNPENSKRNTLNNWGTHNRGRALKAACKSGILLMIITNPSMETPVSMPSNHSTANRKAYKGFKINLLALLFAQCKLRSQALLLPRFFMIRTASESELDKTTKYLCTAEGWYQE